MTDWQRTTNGRLAPGDRVRLNVERDFPDGGFETSALPGTVVRKQLVAGRPGLVLKLEFSDEERVITLAHILEAWVDRE